MKFPKELELRLTTEDSSSAEVRRTMAVYGAVLEAFGWHAHTVADGWSRWTAFSREGAVAVADAHRDTSLLAIRREGEKSAFCCTIPDLFVLAGQFALDGFGRIPDGETLAILLAWLCIDACGLPKSEELIVALAIQNARIATEYLKQ
ncbi:hypothetical protein [Cupriavidus campinensis]